MVPRHRRTILAALAGTAVAGCLQGDSDDENAGTGVPDACPKSHDLDVEWPDEMDNLAAASFVSDYEEAYFREEKYGGEPPSRLYFLDVSTRVQGAAEPVDDGFRMEVRVAGGIYNQDLVLDPERSEAPEDADVAPLEDIEDGPLCDALERAAAGEDVLTSVEDGDEIDRTLEILESLFPAFEPPVELKGPDTVYVDADGTTVELTVRSDGHHGDNEWYAWYYVDETVVYRTGREDKSPRDGLLLECRDPP